MVFSEVRLIKCADSSLLLPNELHLSGAAHHFKMAALCLVSASKQQRSMLCLCYDYDKMSVVVRIWDMHSLITFTSSYSGIVVIFAAWKCAVRLCRRVTSAIVDIVASLHTDLAVRPCEMTLVLRA